MNKKFILITLALILAIIISVVVVILNKTKNAIPRRSNFYIL